MKRFLLLLEATLKTQNMKPIDNTETLPDEFITDVRNIIENGRKKAYDTIIRTSIKTFWDVGKRIIEEEQKGKTRAKYGTHLIKNLSYVLTPIYGNSYNKRNLEYYRKFYILFPKVEIVNTRVHNLEWSHIRRVLSVSNPEARLWYLENTSSNI